MYSHEDEKKEKSVKREMTYQVGWSRGSIRPARIPDAKTEEGSRHSNETVRVSGFTYRGMRKGSFAERVIWRRLPGIPGSWIGVLLWAAPVISFALTYALVAALMRSPSR